MKTGIELIAEERARQISQEGWTLEHDDQHINHELAMNAADCLLSGTDCSMEDWRPEGRPCWNLAQKHKGDRQRQLAIAGALIAAEIDRLQRRGT